MSVKDPGVSRAVGLLEREELLDSLQRAGLVSEVEDAISR